MPRIPITPLPSTTQQDDLTSKLRGIFRDLETALQGQTLVTSRTDNKVERGLKTSDVVIRFYKGRLQFGIWDGKRARFLDSSDLQVLQSNNTNFKGRQTGTNIYTHANVLALFPNLDDWGFYNRNTGTLHLVYNVDPVGPLLGVQLI